MEDRHVAAQVGHVADDVRGEDDDHVVADGAEEVVEADALLRIEAGGGLVDDDEAGLAEERLRDAEALLHSAGEAAEGLLADVEEVRLLEERVDDVAPLLGVA